MKKETKLFAFKLAEKAQDVSKGEKWQARKGLTAATCSDVRFGVQKYNGVGADTGAYC